MMSLREMVETDAYVYVIDALVDMLTREAFDFKCYNLNQKGPLTASSDGCARRWPRIAKKDKAEAFQQVCRPFVSTPKDWKLSDGKARAVNAGKVIAQNSLKNNSKERKVKHHLACIDRSISKRSGRHPVNTYGQQCAGIVNHRYGCGIVPTLQCAGGM